MWRFYEIIETGKCSSCKKGDIIAVYSTTWFYACFLMPRQAFEDGEDPNVFPDVPCLWSQNKEHYDKNKKILLVKKIKKEANDEFKSWK